MLTLVKYEKGSFQLFIVSNTAYDFSDLVILLSYCFILLHISLVLVTNCVVLQRCVYPVSVIVCVFF